MYQNHTFLRNLTSMFCKYSINFYLSYFFLLRWFDENTTASQSEEKLLKKNSNGNFVYPDGVFLVRKSETSPDDFSVTVKFQNAVQKFRIYNRDNTFYIWKPKVFKSLNQLVDHHRNNTISKKELILLKDMIEEKNLYKAAYDFVAREENELSVKKDDVVNVIDNSDDMNGWWEAELNGVSGLVPAEYFVPI